MAESSLSPERRYAGSALPRNDIDVPYVKIAERLYQQIQRESNDHRRQELEERLAIILCLIEIQDSIGKLIGTLERMSK